MRLIIAVFFMALWLCVCVCVCVCLFVFLCGYVKIFMRKQVCACMRVCSFVDMLKLCENARVCACVSLWVC